MSSSREGPHQGAEGGDPKAGGARDARGRDPEELTDADQRVGERDIHTLVGDLLAREQRCLQPFVLAREPTLQACLVAQPQRQRAGERHNKDIDRLTAEEKDDADRRDTHAERKRQSERVVPRLPRGEHEAEHHRVRVARDGTPDKVLSEGEQRAVALADFLTEVALDDQSAGIILDDPVTSLDFEWKDTIARYVVGEAKRRQVIVFTHDLHFLHCLREEADGSKVPLASHWIEKRGGTPGWVFLDNSPVVEKDYKSTKKVSDLLKRASAPGAPPDEQQRLLGDAFGALRTCYEAFVIFDLFGDVVRRFEERVSIERMKAVVIDPAIRDEVIEKVGMLSRYIQGHLHSDRFGAQKPTPELLKRELESFEALRKRLKELKKASGAE